MKRNMALCMLAVFAMGLLVFSACKAVSDEDQAATITGKITPHGTILEDTGTEYLLAGERVSEFTKNVGKSFELKGTVMKEGDRMMITVHEYRLLESSSELVAPAQEPLVVEPLIEEPIKMLLQEEEGLP